MMKISTLGLAEDKKDFIKRFSELPKKLYPDRPLPPSTYWSLLEQTFKQVKKEFFILSIDGQDVGRIGCNISKEHTNTGFFGFFEISPNHKEQASLLIDEVETWLESNGARTTLGPIDFNVWLGNRFKIQSGAKAYSWEPHNPHFYPELFQVNGYELDQGYISMFYDDSVLSFNRTRPSYEAAINEGYKFRNLDLSREDETSKLYNLNLKAFSINYMYEKITYEQYLAVHISAVRNLDLQYSFFIQDPNGEEIGYVFSFIDSSGEQIIKSILIDPKHQGAKLASALLHASVSQGRKNGYIKCVGAMVRKGNVSEHFFDHLQKPISRREYSLFKKELQTGQTGGKS